MNANLNRGSSRYIDQTYKEEYKSFVPSLINRSFDWKDKQINILLGDAMHALGQLNAYAQLTPSIDRHIPLFIAREVVASNHIETINSQLQQAFLPPHSSSEKCQQSWQELRNYIKAINWAVEELKHYPLSIRLVKKTHKILFSGLPEEHHFAGKMREGSPLEKSLQEEDISYLPPDKHEIKRLVNDGKKFWRNDDLELPHLIKMAISLYQFENILPFLNGNGRTVRTLMILELLSVEYLTKPILCLSAFFERNRMEYYHRLNLIRTRNDIEQWIRFFLNGIRETAEESIQIITQINDLKSNYTKRIENKLGVKRHKTVHRLLDHLYTKPFMSVNEMSELLGLSFQSTNQLVKDMEKTEIIHEISGVKRNRIYTLWEYLTLFE